MISHEAQVSEGAYRLWDLAGRPEGRDQEFWYAAELWAATRGTGEHGSGDLTMPLHPADQHHAPVETSSSLDTLIDASR